MAEALTVIGLVANIAQFTEYGLKLFSEAKTIYKGGTSKATLDLTDATDVSQRIEYLMEQVKDSINSCSSLRTANGNIDMEVEMEMHNRYRGISTDLWTLVKGFDNGKARNRVMASIQLAVRGHKNRAKIEVLKAKLSSLREDVNARNIFLLRKNQNQIMEQITEIQRNGDMVTNSIGEIETLIKSRIACMSRDIQTAFARLAPLFADAASHATTSGSTLKPVERLQIEHSNEILLRFSKDAVRLDWQARIISSLSFRAMRDRNSSIREKHGNTLEWVLKPDETNKGPGLYSWLKQSDGLFWITGKAGSGKSTLVKFLCRHGTTLQLLQTWAGDVPLLFVSHYFWISGLSVQRSISGLYRGLLYQIFSQRHELLPLVKACKSRMPRVQMDWTLEELEEALEEACQAALIDGVPQFKLCIFIDGLDEYDDENKHKGIVNIIAKLASYPNIKLCISSRPWSQFEKAYGDEKPVPQLRLHELTLSDMKAYTIDNISADCGEFKALASKDAEMYNSIVMKITTRAEGVWLWLYLVIRRIVRDLMCDEIDIFGIEKAVERYPTDIDAYLRNLLGRGEPRYQEEAARIFLTVTEANGCFPGLGVRLLLGHMEQSQQIQMALQPKALFNASTFFEINYRTTRNQMNNRCRDLLEMELHGVSAAGYPDKHPFRLDDVFERLTRHKATFIHRCVGDFFRLHYSASLLEQAQKSGPFDPKIFLAIMFVVLLRSSVTFFANGDPEQPRREAFCHDTFLKSFRKFLEVAADFDASADALDSRMTQKVARASSDDLQDRHSDCSQTKTGIFYRLIDEVKYIVSGFFNSIGLLYMRSTPIPVETIFFTRLALVAKLGNYVRHQIIRDGRILSFYPQLIHFGVQPVDLDYFLPRHSELYYNKTLAPWSYNIVTGPTADFQEHDYEARASSILKFFRRYLGWHPGELKQWNKTEVASAEALGSFTFGANWSAADGSMDCELVEFLLDHGPAHLVNLPTPSNVFTSLFLGDSKELMSWMPVHVISARFDPLAVRRRTSIWSLFLAILLGATGSMGGRTKTLYGSSPMSSAARWSGCYEMAALLLRKGAAGMLLITDIERLQFSKNKVSQDITASKAIMELWGEEGHSLLGLIRANDTEQSAEDSDRLIERGDLGWWDPEKKNFVPLAYAPSSQEMFDCLAAPVGFGGDEQTGHYAALEKKFKRRDAIARTYRPQLEQRYLSTKVRTMDNSELHPPITLKRKRSIANNRDESQPDRYMRTPVWTSPPSSHDEKEAPKAYSTHHQERINARQRNNNSNQPSFESCQGHSFYPDSRRPLMDRYRERSRDRSPPRQVYKRGGYRARSRGRSPPPRNLSERDRYRRDRPSDRSSPRMLHERIQYGGRSRERSPPRYMTERTRFEGRGYERSPSRR